MQCEKNDCPPQTSPKHHASCRRLHRASCADAARVPSAWARGSSRRWRACVERAPCSHGGRLHASRPRSHPFSPPFHQSARWLSSTAPVSSKEPIEARVAPRLCESCGGSRTRPACARLPRSLPPLLAAQARTRTHHACGTGRTTRQAPRDSPTRTPFSFFFQDSLAGVSGISGRYATALFQAGKKAGKLDAIDKDLAQVREEGRGRGNGEPNAAARPLSPYAPLPYSSPPSPPTRPPLPPSCATAPSPRAPKPSSWRPCCPTPK